MTSVMVAVPIWAASLPARTFMERVGSTRTMPGASASTTEFTLAYASSMAFPEGCLLYTSPAELQQISQFRNPDINTEVWFVALGSELAQNGGMRAFIT